MKPTFKDQIAQLLTESATNFAQMANSLNKPQTTIRLFIRDQPELSAQLAINRAKNTKAQQALRAQILSQLQAGQTIPQVAAAHNLNRSTVYRYMVEAKLTATQSTPPKYNLCNHFALHFGFSKE